MAGLEDYFQTNKKWAKQAFRRGIKLLRAHPRRSARVVAAILRKKAFEQALHFYEIACKIAPNRAAWHFGRGKCLLELERNVAAADAFEIAIQINPHHAAYHDRLATILRRLRRTWQEIDALERAAELNPTNAHVLFRLGEARDLMNDYHGAIKAYRTATELKGNATWFYRLGRSAQLAGDEATSAIAYEQARKLDTSLNSKRFGIGVFHEKRQEWDLAAEAFATAAADRPDDAQFHIKLAHSLAKCGRWQEALDQTLIALTASPNVPKWHYEVGRYLEKLERWKAAADAYLHAAVTKPKPTKYWFYRAGYAFFQAGLWADSVAAFLRSKPDQKHVKSTAGDISVRYFQLACQAEDTGEMDEAVANYQKAVERRNDFTPEWYYRYGAALAALGRHKDAATAFINIRRLRSEHGVDETPYRANRYLWRTTCYREYYDHLPVVETQILYECFAGRSISCNPYAMFKSALADDELRNFTHIWCVDDMSKAPSEFAQSENVIFVKRDSDLYLRYLASSKYLINNATFPPYFVRKPDQVYLNTWHGTPWKTLGSDMKGRFQEHKTFARNILQATHLLSPNPHTTEVIVARQGVSNAMTADLIELGYPRIDLTLNQTEDARRSVLERLNIPADKPVILYAPTWRGTLTSVDLDSDKLLHDLKALSSENYTLLFRGHSLQEKAIKNLDIDCLAAPDVDTNELLSVTDLLVTDYSSVLFDFAPLGRPIALYVHDLDEYERDRGLYFKTDEVPGTVCQTISEVANFVSNNLGKTADYERFKPVFYPHDNGSVSMRVWAAIRAPRTDVEARGKKRVLFFAGPFIPNGITSSALNLLHAINTDKYDLTLVLEAGAISKSPERMERISQLPADLAVYSRSGATVMTLEERTAVEYFNKWHRFASQDMRHAYERAYRFEFRRMFGEATFDAVVNFEGYARFWASLLASSSTTRKVIFLHNDMKKEHQKRFPYLAGIFKFYESYDNLVSVSETMSGINAGNFEGTIDSTRFCNSTNLIDADKIKALASDPCDLELSRWVGDRKCLVTLGRLSPEKDHEKLIFSFVEAVGDREDVCLVVAGDGPLRAKMDDLVRAQRLEKKVRFAGLLPNPFPLLARADCFVLSSNHEGQPMVLLEALVLNKPIIATDIDGNRGALGSTLGLLVPNSVGGLAEGIRTFLTGRVVATPFDHAAYNCASLQKLESIIDGTS